MNYLKSMRQYLGRIGQWIWSNPLGIFQHLNTRNFKILIRAIRQEPTGLIFQNLLQLLETGKSQIAQQSRFVGEGKNLKIYLLHCRKEAGVLIVLVWILSKHGLDEAWIEWEGKKLTDFQDAFVKPQLSTSFSEFENYQQQGLVFQVSTEAPLPACLLCLKDLRGKEQVFPIGEMSVSSRSAVNKQANDSVSLEHKLIVLLHNWGTNTGETLHLDKIVSLVLAASAFGHQIVLSINPDEYSGDWGRIEGLTQIAIPEKINLHLQQLDFEHLLVLPMKSVLSTSFFQELDIFLKAEPALGLGYFDEGLYESNELIHSLHLKPAFSPDLLAVDNYIGASFITSKALLEAINWFSSSDFVAAGYDLLLRSLVTDFSTFRVPNTFVYSPDYRQQYYVKRAAVEEEVRIAHFQKQGIFVSATKTVDGSSELIYTLKDTPLISIIIPFKDRIDLLQQCIESILDKTEYPYFEVLLISNNSAEKETFEYLDQCCASEKRMRWLAWDEPFNYSALNNWAVQQAKGQALLFLNNDIEVLSTSWLTKMLGYLQQEQVGAVGAKLLYPDTSVQHAGVVVGIGGIAAHAHKHYPDSFGSYQGRANKVQNVSACTAACLLVRRSVFEATGGFDALNLPIAFNDVDLCLKIRTKGYRIVYHPGVKLYHYESISRGAENTKAKRVRAKREIEFFRRQWAEFIEAGDPYYHPGLSIGRADFEVDRNGVG